MSQERSDGVNRTRPQVAPYGSWRSPITSDLIVSETIGPGQLALDGDAIYWIESRPTEGGRSVLVRWSGGRASDVTPPSFNVRSRVHEYGGGAFTVSGGTVYFSNFDDNRLYRQDAGAAPRPITLAGPLRYADLRVDRQRGRIICVREDHTFTDREPVNTLVSLDVEGRGRAQILASGNDFYASPRLSPDGSQLAWLTWNHPNMPWDGTELWAGRLASDGSIAEARLVAGGPGESIFQPEWSPDGVLHFVSDRTGWWNLYRWRAERVEALHPMEAEFGLPQWVFGMTTYGFDSADRIVCSYITQGLRRLALLDTASGAFEPLETGYTEIASPRVGGGQVVFVGGSPTEPLSLVRFTLATRQIEVLRRSSELAIDEGELSRPEPIAFPTTNQQTAHAFFYRPRNLNYIGPPDERPPLLVLSHGGPTAATSTELDLGIQFWTSRGIAVLDVNYGGSTGYGRGYRERLYGQWGVVDVDDCVNGARYLVERGDVDGRRMAIRGGSAGGYTTLCALTFHADFGAGASHFGIADLEPLARDTHKFESRYLERLIGPYPERSDLYRERSPINYTERLSCPVILFQGLDDKVVPPNQAELMVEALRKKGLPFAYIPFEGEGHGFRKAENIKRALDAELFFYQKYLFWPGAPLPEGVEEVPLE